MTIYLVEDHPELSRIEAESWDAAQAALEGKGHVIGELVEERRSAALHAEFKFEAGNEDTREIVGYGAVFGNIDSYGDVIAPGAFAKSLADIRAGNKAMPAMLLAHNPEALPVGKWMEMSEDSTGLRVKGFLLDTTQGMDTYKALKAGAITGLSIGFRPVEYALRSRPDEPRRTLKSVDLLEVSVVGFPANDKARVLSVKSADDINTIRDLEHCLRDAGYSKSESARIASRYEAKSDRRDAGEEAAKLAAQAADRLIAMLKEQ
jgi:uncharacterized protein